MNDLAQAYSSQSVCRLCDPNLSAGFVANTLDLQISRTIWELTENINTATDDSGNLSGDLNPIALSLETLSGAWTLLTHVIPYSIENSDLPVGNCDLVWTALSSEARRYSDLAEAINRISGQSDDIVHLLADLSGFSHAIDDMSNASTDLSAAMRSATDRCEVRSVYTGVPDGLDFVAEDLDEVYKALD